MRYGIVVYKDSFNLGDDIQSYATERFLPHTDFVVDREKMDSFFTDDGKPISVILGGWYLYNHLNWPPSPFITPFLISMHFDTYYSCVAGEKITKNMVLEDYGREWLIKNGPVGCRDLETKKLLERYGIPVFFSGCLTLTIASFNNIPKNDKIFLVDVPKSVEKYIRQKAGDICEELTHSIKMEGMPWCERRKIVEDRLKLYQGAKLVVTTRLHAALPCLALGTPVLFLKEEWSLNRTGTWLEYLHYTSIENLLSGQFKYDFLNPIDNKDDYKKIADRLVKNCEEFIDNQEKGNNEICLDIKMFSDGLKRTERVKKLFNLRIDKYESELYGR